MKFYHGEILPPSVVDQPYTSSAWPLFAFGLLRERREGEQHGDGGA
ncbi:hypothetical protein [Paenibacillus methanolicus]|nr:hypothetical protein [Paenibacillus methanolicus]